MLTREQIMAMTPEQLRIEIAKALGYKKGEGRMDIAYYFDYEWWHTPGGGRTSCLPNWPADIAAMYALEETIPEHWRNGYAEILADVIEPNNTMNLWWWQFVHATAEQRARAWLIWKESEK